VAEGSHGCGGDMTMVLRDVLMLVTIIVVLIPWMSKMRNVMMNVVILTVSYMLMVVS